MVSRGVHTGHLAQHDMAAATATNAAISFGDRLRLLRQPDAFTGQNGEEVNGWIEYMEQYLACLQITDDGTKLSYGTMNLKGRAQKWMKSLAVLKRSPQSWNDFKVAIIAQYQDRNAVDNARMRLDRLTQVGSVFTYNEKFMDIMIDIGDSMGEVDRVWNYKKGLKVQQRMHVDLQKPQTLAEAMETAVKVDNSIWSSRQNRSVNGYGHKDGTVAMELDAVGTKTKTTYKKKTGKQSRPEIHLDKDEYQRRRSTGLCLKCGKAGHFIKDCTHFQ